MRVLLVTPSYHAPARAHGAEILSRVFATKLNSMGIHADIMTLNRNKTDGRANASWREETIEDGSFKVFKESALNPPSKVSNPMFELLRINFIPKTWFLSKLREYDVLHFIGEADLSLLCFSYFIRKPKLMQCLGIYRNGGIYKYYMYDHAYRGRTFKKIFPRLADRFLVSYDQEKILLREMGVPYEKMVDLPVCVDTDVFKPRNTQGSDNLLLFVGRIDKIKGLHILLRALSYVQVPVHLAIIGPDWNPPEYAKKMREISSMINNHGFHKVTFKGSMSQDDLVPWFQRASIVVCPFLYEAYSNVVRESLACGTPVLSTGAHILETGEDGIFITSRNPKDMAHAITKLLEDEEMREKYGREGRKLIEEHFSPESVIRKLRQLYVDLINRHSA